MKAFASNGSKFFLSFFLFCVCVCVCVCVWTPLQMRLDVQVRK